MFPRILISLLRGINYLAIIRKYQNLVQAFKDLEKDARKNFSYKSEQV